MVPGVGNDLDPPTTPHGPFDGLSVADGAPIEVAIEFGVGGGPPLAHGNGELGNPGDPVVDRARRHAQQPGELVEAGASPAVLARLCAQVRTEQRGTSASRHHHRWERATKGGVNAAEVALFFMV
jgi:hypothetical protein